ncbi:MAG: biotin--[acetyl-CoA-carboxylase] ligase [Pseudomonadota bacterium]
MTSTDIDDLDAMTHRRVFGALNSTGQSAAELSERLLISVDEVIDGIRVLTEKSAPISRAGDVWTRFGDGELLSDAQFTSHLPEEVRAAIEHLTIADDIDSTNAYLVREARSGIAVCMAESQHAGRGRRGKRWVSPYATNVYLSMSFRWDGALNSLSSLSIASGVAVADTLQVLALRDAQLKWPNDVLVSDEKIAGILVETSIPAAGAPLVVIGVGINVCETPGGEASQIDQPWTSIERTLARHVSRNRVAAALLSNLYAAVTTFSADGIDPFLPRWRQLDVLEGHTVNAQSATGVVTGVANGIDEDGALRLTTAEGEVVRINSGAVTIRRAPEPHDG